MAQLRHFLCGLTSGDTDDAAKLVNSDTFRLTIHSPHMGKNRRRKFLRKKSHQIDSGALSAWSTCATTRGMDPLD